MMDMHDGWGWWMVFGWIWMVIFWGLIIWAVFAITSRHGHGEDRTQRRSSDAITILEERYARGEITRDQFEEARRVLTRGDAPRTT